MTQIDWTNFTKKIKIDTTLENAYNHWVSPELLCIWFLKDVELLDSDNNHKLPTDQVAKDDTYIWKWHNYDGEEKGTILDVKPQKQLVFSFANEANKVKVSFKEIDNQVQVELNQYNIATDEKTKYDIFYGCSNGWTFWLANLKAYLEHGILLHDTELGKIDDKNSCGEYVNT